MVCVSLFQGHMQSDDDGVVAHMQSGFQEVERFLDNSVEDITGYVKGEFDTISSSVLKKVNESGQSAVDDALDLLNATSLLNEARSVSKEALAIKSDLDNAVITLQELQNETEDLSKRLETIQKDVESVCTGAEPCPGYKPEDYSVKSNFTNLKTLEDEANKVAKSLNMSKYVDQAEQSIDEAKTKATESIKGETDKANKAINDVKQDIDKGLKDLNTQKDDASKDLQRFRGDLDDAKGDVKEYSDYVYYAGLGIFCVMLLIILLYYVGVLYGLCGERPGHGAPCCNTGTGANFLMAGVAFTFMFTWLLMVICTLLFLIGGPAYTEVCRYFDGHDPSKFQVFDDALTKGLDISNFYKNAPPDLSLVKTLQDCQKNEALFSALNLDYIVDLDEILDIKDLENEIDELKDKTVDISDVDILNPELEKDLQSLADSGLENIPFQSYFEQLNKELTSAPLEDLATNLDGLAQDKTGQQRATLEKSAADLRSLETSHVVPISNKMIRLNNTMKELQKNSNIKDPLNQLIKHMNESQTKFNSEKDALVKKEISELADSINKETNSSVEEVKREIRTDRARCSSLSNALYTVSDSVCILVLRPLNGFWFSLGWCLIFCIPCLIFAVLLASQYRREHQYVKEFEDPNYLMYGGPNPDTIPLTRIMEEQRFHGRGGPVPSGAGYGGHHGYPYPGESNPGYSHDPYRATPPPPYEDHSKYHRYQGQHHDLAAEYPGLYDQPGHLARPQLPAPGSSGSHSYAYPY
ncbi:hypothetical protein RRG08_064628 [Elysia crispata]|uniref:Prominin-like protein n=1 Tax=Elysia crispata TaxID=231223 RepID=A0AAE1ECV6_9GAST|nr:hypothetical protein RRG08_064628 [Elysia crispata]